MISPERLEKALIYMAESDQPFADAKMDMDRAEHKAKAIRDTVFLHEAGTVAERSAKAGVSEDYNAAVGEYLNAVGTYEYIRNKRHTEELVIDCWRTIEASRRRA